MKRQGQGKAQVACDAERITVSLVELSPSGLYCAAVRSVLQLEIHDAGHGVGPVLSRCAVAQDFHALEGNGRDRSQIRRVRPLRIACAQEGDNG